MTAPARLYAPSKAAALPLRRMMRYDDFAAPKKKRRTPEAAYTDRKKPRGLTLFRLRVLSAARFPIAYDVYICY